MRWLWIAWLALLCLMVGAVHGCQADGQRSFLNPPPTTTPPDAADFDAGMGDGPPPLDSSEYCGNELHEVTYETPNLYFVLDRSGSMATEEPNGESRYKRVRDAAIDLVESLGPLINVGAALFPQGNIDDDPCTDGGEVFAVTPGDPMSEQPGPTTLDFAWATNVTPKGGTPIAATLADVHSSLAALPGRTVVLLATDGGPNCNADASCGIDECIPNIEGTCPAGTNCCLPGGAAGPTLCIDRQPTVAAIAAIHDLLGIDLYVIGITGSSVYGDVLDEMAEAGGTAQTTGPHKYLKVDDLATLGDVFAAIAAEAISCEFGLQEPPEEEGMTNVYLDSDVVPYDPVDGWSWSGDGTTVILNGQACLDLKTGEASKVQIVTGCPTYDPH